MPQSVYETDSTLRVRQQPAVMRTPARQPGARPSRERPISGNRPDEVNVADGAISRIRRDDLNDREVSEGDGHALALTARSVAIAVIARRSSATHVRPIAGFEYIGLASP
jgi:hypothetical protein